MAHCTFIGNMAFLNPRFTDDFVTAVRETVHV